MDLAFVLQFADGGRITSQAVSGEHPRGSIIGIRQGSLQEAFGGFPIASFGQVEVHRLPAAIDGAKQVHPTTRNAHKGLVYVPGRSFVLDFPS